MRRIPAQQRDKFFSRAGALKVSIKDFVEDFNNNMGVPQGEKIVFDNTIDDLMTWLNTMRASLQAQD